MKVRLLSFVTWTWYWRWTVLSMFALMIGSGIVTGLIFQTNLLFPTVQRLQLSEYIGEGTVDRTIDIHYSFQRFRQCKTDTVAAIWKWKLGGDNKWRKNIVKVDNIPVPLSDSVPGSTTDIIVSYPTPVGIDMGYWFFYTKSFDYCTVINFIFGPTERHSTDVLVRVAASTAEWERIAQKLEIPSADHPPLHSAK